MANAWNRVEPTTDPNNFESVLKELFQRTDENRGLENELSSSRDSTLNDIFTRVVNPDRAEPAEESSRSGYQRKHVASRRDLE